MSISEIAIISTSKLKPELPEPEPAASLQKCVVIEKKLIQSEPEPEQSKLSKEQLWNSIYGQDFILIQVIGVSPNSCDCDPKTPPRIMGATNHNNCHNYFSKKKENNISTSLTDLSFLYPWNINVIRIPSRYVTLTIILLPLGVFLFSIFWALYSNYRAATLVHCNERQVKNYLPSISSAIGDFSFSKGLWITCITLLAPPRFYYVHMYYKFLQSIVFRKYRVWISFACFLHILGNFAMLGLSYISSKTSLFLHVFNFAVFIIASEIYMLIVCVLLIRCRNIQCSSAVEKRGQKVKVRLLIVSVVCSLVMPYLYIRHECFCEDGIYTIFAVFEYILVLCNMGFHLTAYWDFYDVEFKINVRKYWLVARMAWNGT